MEAYTIQYIVDDIGFRWLSRHGGREFTEPTTGLEKRKRGKNYCHGELAGG